MVYVKQPVEQQEQQQPSQQQRFKVIPCKTTLSNRYWFL
jgi:hypothetical protein